MSEIAVEKLAPGTLIVLPNGMAHRVTEVREFDDGTLVVVYADSTLNSWENKATDKGKWRQTTIAGLEKSLRPLRRGELVRVAAA